jgi:hypothetical protein
MNKRTLESLDNFGAHARAQASEFGPTSTSLVRTTRYLHFQSEHRGRERHVFAGFDVRGVAHNLFLDGNPFRSSPSVERRGFVYDLKAGVSVRIPPARISLTHIFRSEEFTTPMGGGGTQRFQSLNFSWEF